MSKTGEIPIYLWELLTKDEECHPELRPFLYHGQFGLGIHHKWIIELLVQEGKFALINARYEAKKKMIEKAKKEGNFSSFLIHHERPYRLAAYLEILPDIIRANNPKQEGELFRYIWTDTENFFQNKKTWKKLWNSVARGHVMTPEEQEVFAKLPNPLTIYRGIRYASGKNGLSWTTDKEKAIWFANRLRGPNKILLSGTLKKCHVRAYLEDRETEVVTFPWHVQGMTETRL